MNKPIAFPALAEDEVVEITAKHGNLHAFSTRVGPRFYVVCADASAPAQSKRMGIDFWGGLSAADVPSRATALSVYNNCVAIATISGSLVVGSMDRPIPAILHPGNIPRGCLSLVGEGMVASAVSGTQDKICITTFDSHNADAVCEHEEPMFAVPNSLVASEERVAVCDVSNSVSVFSLTRIRHDDGRTSHGLHLTHVLPCLLSVMSIRGNILLVRDDDAASKVRVMGLKDNHASELASIACNNADASHNCVACIEESGGDPALVMYRVSEEGGVYRQPPRRLSDIQVSSEQALGFVVSLAGHRAVITSKSAPQMWVVS
jgi:hypothetical protein